MCGMNLHTVGQDRGYNAIKGNRYQDTLKDAVVGDYKWSARNADFSGWLLCDGRSLSRITYSDLYATIGTTFGSPSSGYFSIPDCRGKVAGSVGQGAGLTNRVIGDVVGTERHTLKVDQLPSHTHTGTTDVNGYHTHNTNSTSSLGLTSNTGRNTMNSTVNDGSEPDLYVPPAQLTIDAMGSHTHTFTTNSTGGNVAFNIMQPTIFLGNVFIYSGVLENQEPTVYTDGKGDDEYM